LQHNPPKATELPRRSEPRCKRNLTFLRSDRVAGCVAGVFLVNWRPAA
jgi:hypothetical protein